MGHPVAAKIGNSSKKIDGRKANYYPFGLDRNGDEHKIQFGVGKILENVWGPQRFLLFYLVCGVGAAALHLGIQYYRWEEAEQLLQAGREMEAYRLVSSIGPALGASGAVMGIFVAFGYLFPNTELYFMFIPMPISIGTSDTRIYFDLNTNQKNTKAINETKTKANPSPIKEINHHFLGFR